MRIVIKTLSPLIWLICRLLVRIKFYGVDNIPPKGACILTPNHITYFDPIWITIPVRRRIFFMAWDKPFEIPVLGFLMRLFGAFPLSLDRFDPAALREAMERLSKGCALVVFPEGGRTKTGALEPFKLGAFRLALTYGAPIVPVTVNGAFDVWPAGQFLPRLGGRVSVTYHPPIEVERIAEGTSRGELKEQARKLALVTRAQIEGSLKLPRPKSGSPRLGRLGDKTQTFAEEPNTDQ
jgi:1-acyl-sn-glycerol-3-phosphate acyltransferase